MKVALCFIISYEHILNKEQIWIDWIKPNQDIINVYFHYKNIQQIRSPWIKTYSLPPNKIAKTTYYYVVPGYISVLSYAFQHDPENIWFCLLTDACVPIISPEHFRNLFFQHYQASIFKSGPSFWNIDLHRRANLRYLKKEFHLANTPWFVLTRRHVKMIFDFILTHKDIYNKVCRGGLANESLFAIILQTYHELTNQHTLVNEISTITDWSRMSNPTSPHLFVKGDSEDIRIIDEELTKNKYAMFLRKVDKKFPDELLKDFIYNRKYDHVYSDLHNQAKKKRQFYNYFMKMNIFFFLFAFIYFFIW